MSRERFTGRRLFSTSTELSNYGSPPAKPGVYRLNYVTSDAPAYVRREGHYDDPTLVGAARADLNAEIIFPISKNSLLIAKHKPCRAVVRATKTRVQTLNAVTIRMAYKHVFASHESEQVKRLVNLSRDLPSLVPDVNTNFAKRFDKQLRSFRVED
jgi:hypothetical protein